MLQQFLVYNHSCNNFYFTENKKYYELGIAKGYPNITLYPDSGYTTAGTAYITYTFDKPDGYNYLAIDFTPNYISGGYVKINDVSIYSGKSNYTGKIDISSYSKISLSLSSGKGEGTYSRALATVVLSAK